MRICPFDCSVKFTLLALIGVVSVAPVRAVDFNWNGSVDNDWLNGANWTPAGPPAGGGGNHAFINNGGTARISADVPQVQDWFIGRGATGTGTVEQTAGNASNVGWTFIGTDGGAGTFNLTGAGNTTGSGSLTTGRIYVGGVRDLGGGTGTMRVNTTGTVTAGSDLAVSTRGGNGTLNITAGTVIANSWMIVGETHNGVGGGTGTVVQDGGAVRVGAVDANGPLWLGSQEGSASTIRSTGNYTLNNGTLSTSEIVVGRHYDGNFTQNGGAVTAGRGTSVAQNTGSIGNFNISGASTFTQTTPADLNNQNTWNHIGQNGMGTFNLSGTAEVSFSSRTHLGSGGTGNGTVNQTGGLFQVRDHELVIGDTGVGTFNVSAGTVRTMGTSPILVGHWNNSTGNLNVSGSAVIESGGDLIVGNGDQSAGSTAIANGTLTQSGGTVRAGVTAGGNLIIGNDLEAVGVYNLQGGTLDVTGGNILRGAGTGTFNFTGGRLQDASNINNFDLAQQGGTLAPGPAGGIGTTAINSGPAGTGAYSLALPGTLELNIEVADFDELVVAGTVTLAGNLDLIPGAGLANGQTFQIITNNSVLPVSGAFAGKPDDTQFFEDGATWSINYQGGDGNDVVLTHVIPEPTGAALVFGTLVVGALVRRRRS